jgi:hypothetical protein
MPRAVLAMTVLVAVSVIAGTPMAAKVVMISLADLAQRAEFIGVVRVDRIGMGIPFLRQPRADATILESWKGKAQGRVRFVAAPTWACDISDAKKGEEAIVFVSDGALLHSGRGRMPVFTRDGRRLATIWVADVILPAEISIEDGPEPEYRFIRAVGVDDLRDAVAKADGV